MRGKILAMVLVLVMLAGCSDQRTGATSALPEKENSAAVQSPGRAEETLLDEAVQAELYVGDGYSVYIPSEGWTLELQCEEEIPHQRWDCDEGDAHLTVYLYENVSFAVARDRYVKDCGYVFTDTLGAEPGDPIFGKNKKGDLCGVMVAEGDHGITYVIAWEYSAAAQESCGAVLGAMAETFLLTGIE